MARDDDGTISLAEARRRKAAAAAPEWARNLMQTDKGGYKPNLANVEMALRLAPEWRGVFGYNSFAQRIEFTGKPPFDPAPPRGSEWRDHHDTQAAIWCQMQGLGVTDLHVSKAVEIVARANEFHPVRSYLRALRWDGIRRLDAMLRTHFDAQPREDDDEGHAKYLAAIGSKWMISAVARVMQPGCKVDTTLILEGKQGARKSSALRALASDEWFKDDVGDLRDKDAAEGLIGQWLVEFAELASLKGAVHAAVKAFLTRQVDKIRPAYGKRTVTFPRQCIFCGSENSDSYLDDETGNRRFWPVDVGEIKLDRIVADRDQLWAEAVARFDRGERWWFDDAREGDEMAALVRGEQRERLKIDPWHDTIGNFVHAKSDTSVAEILEFALFIGRSDWAGSHLTRVARTLVTLGWEKYRARSGRTRENRYRLKVPGSLTQEGQIPLL